MSTRSACMRPCMCVVVCVSSCFDVPPSAGSYHFPSTYISQREPLSSLKTKLLQVQLLTSFWILHRLAWQKFWNPPSYRHHLLLCPHHLDHLQTNFATMERRRDQHRTKDNQRQQYKKKKKRRQVSSAQACNYHRKHILSAFLQLYHFIATTRATLLAAGNLLSEYCLDPFSAAL